jgi:hypothetical protein
VDESSFYKPKIVLCSFLWLSMVVEKAYLSMSRASDPSYFVTEYSDSTFMAIRVFGLAMLLIYLVYFLVVAYLVVFVLNMMKKAYKYLILITLTVIALSLVILFLNGRSTQQVNTPLYVSQYVLFNTYMLLVAYLYSPCMESIPTSRFSRSKLQRVMGSISGFWVRSRDGNSRRQLSSNRAAMQSSGKVDHAQIMN